MSRSDHQYRGAEPASELFRQLGHPLRRRVLFELLDADAGERRHLSEVATRHTTPDRDRIALYHTHLPGLRLAGYVAWDPDAETVARGPRFETIAPFLELLVRHGDRLPDD